MTVSINGKKALAVASRGAAGRGAQCVGAELARPGRRQAAHAQAAQTLRLSVGTRESDVARQISAPASRAWVGFESVLGVSPQPQRKRETRAQACADWAWGLSLALAWPRKTIARISTDFFRLKNTLTIPPQNLLAAIDIKAEIFGFELFICAVFKHAFDGAVDTRFQRGVFLAQANGRAAT